VRALRSDEGFEAHSHSHGPVEGFGDGEDGLVDLSPVQARTSGASVTDRSPGSNVGAAARGTAAAGPTAAVAAPPARAHVRLPQPLSRMGKSGSAPASVITGGEHADEPSAVEEVEEEEDALREGDASRRSVATTVTVDDGCSEYEDVDDFYSTDEEDSDGDDGSPAEAPEPGVLASLAQACVAAAEGADAGGGGGGGGAGTGGAGGLAAAGGPGAGVGPTASVPAAPGVAAVPTQPAGGGSGGITLAQLAPVAKAMLAADSFAMLSELRTLAAASRRQVVVPARGVRPKPTLSVRPVHAVSTTVTASPQMPASTSSSAGAGAGRQAKSPHRAAAVR
jgi:hypothetical protein